VKVSKTNGNVIYFNLQNWRTGGQNRSCLEEGDLVPVVAGKRSGKSVGR
jgi:hypothetical protein